MIGFRTLTAASMALTVGACGLVENQTTISDSRRGELRQIADKASRLSELQRQAYTRNSLLQFSAAEQDYRETLGLARDLFPTDPARASALRLHLALNKSNLGQFESAESLFERSRPIVKEIGAVSDKAKPDLFYAQHKMNLKQFPDAIEIAEAAIATLDGLVEDLRLNRGGVSLGELAMPRQADGTILIDDIQANRANSREIRDASLEANARRITDVQRLQLQRVQANYIIARAVRANDGPESQVDQRIQAAAADLAEVPVVYGRWLRAEVASLEADKLVSENRIDEAVAKLDAAVLLLRNFEINSRPEALLLFKKGEILIEADRGQEGQSAYRAALDIIQSDDQGLDVEQAQSVIDRLLEDVQAGDADARAELFELMQQVRSSATAQTLAQLSARLASGDSVRARAIRDVQNLERQVNILAAKVDRLETDPSADIHYKRVTESRLLEAQGSLDSQRSMLGEIAPNYDQLVDATIPLDEAQKALSDGEVMAIIQLGPEKGLVAILTNVSFDAYEVVISLQTAESEVSELRKPIDGEFLLAFDLEKGHELFKELFGPVKSKVVGADHLIVVPSGPLMSLPFNVLVTEEYDDEIKIVGATPEDAYFDYSKVAWLGKETGITTGVSISSFFIGRRVPPSDAPRAFRGYGDFKRFGENDDIVTRIAQQRGLPESCKISVQALGLLNELEGTKDELEKVREVLGVPDEDVVLGTDFTDAELKGTRLSQYRILHFATHGLLAQDPECLPEPGLITSLAPEGDSLLEASEIVDLRLDAELVVMSACDTSAGAASGDERFTGFRDVGGGYAAGGESLSGLARSFFYAGARNILSTHWSVDDNATQELMVGFYTAAAEDADVSIAEAMRLSQEKQIEGGELSHPFFWAPFATIGDGARKLGVAKGEDA